jgi:hypothetical protein
MHFDIQKQVLNTPSRQLSNQWQFEVLQSVTTHDYGYRTKYIDDNLPLPKVGGPRDWLDRMSDADLTLALELTQNRQRRRYITNKRPDLLFPSQELYHKAKHLFDCGFDRTLASLSWSGIAEDTVTPRLR